MKRTMSLILAAVATTMIVSAAPVFAAPVVTEENGATVVYNTIYVAPDDAVCGQKITYTDGNGTTFVTVYKPQETAKQPEVIAQNVSWTDASGNKYVQDGATVTIYDAAGNVIAVRQA